MTTKRWGSALLTISLLAAACVPAGTDDEISATEASSSTSTGSLTGLPSDSDGTPPATTGPDPTSSSTTSTSTGFDDTDPTAPTDTSTTGMTTNGGEAIPICGDGEVNGDEECDDGPDNSDSAACTSECLAAFCGDGLTQIGKEACDLEEANGDGSYGGCTDLCQLGPHCGDKIHQAEFEECDPLDDSLEDGSKCESCIWNANLIFVSYERFDGALGGLDGADIHCQALAEAALLSNPSSYRAWLSSGAESPTTRITPPMGAYILPNGVQIAASWAELVDGTDLDSAIHVTQKKMPVAKPYRVWSNTAPTGTSLQGPDCNGWTADLVGITGSYGSTEDVDIKWTEADLDWCSQKNRLYCVATAG